MCSDCPDGYIAVAENYFNGQGWIDNNGNFDSVRALEFSMLLVIILWCSNMLDMREEPYLVLPVVGYFWVMSAAFEPLVRYMTPSLGLMFVFTLYDSRNHHASNLVRIKTEK